MRRETSLKHINLMTLRISSQRVRKNVERTSLSELRSLNSTVGQSKVCNSKLTEDVWASMSFRKVGQAQLLKLQAVVEIEIALSSPIDSSVGSLNLRTIPLRSPKAAQSHYSARPSRLTEPAAVRDSIATSFRLLLGREHRITSGASDDHVASQERALFSLRRAAERNVIASDRCRRSRNREISVGSATAS